jgi:hypothetical protein
LQKKKETTLTKTIADNFVLLNHNLGSSGMREGKKEKKICLLKVTPI